MKAATGEKRPKQFTDETLRISGGSLGRELDQQNGQMENLGIRQVDERGAPAMEHKTVVPGWMNGGRSLVGRHENVLSSQWSAFSSCDSFP